jgi:aspartate kinase
MSEIIVQKYGGTSVGSAERIQAVARRVAQFRAVHDRIVIVVSAMGDTTDDLIALSKQISASPNAREYDALISTGENISAALTAMALQELGVPAISLTGPQAGVITQGIHSKSKIAKVNTDRILAELAEGKVVVVTGFQGINDHNDVTTIGRGGSDTSAVVLAAALGAPVCDICTDVDGVYTTDPRKVSDARKIDEISYDEMLELASLGAKVLHPRSVECAKENGIILHVRSSFKMENGTMVKEASAMEVNRPVTGVTLNSGEAQVSILGVPDFPGVAGKVFTKLADASVNVDMIIQSLGLDGKNQISFTVDEDDLARAKDVTEAVARELGARHVECDNEVAKVSIVGVGMMSKPGVAATLFRTLGDNGINIRLISTSEIKVSCVVPKSEGEKALRLLHSAFELGQ